MPDLAVIALLGAVTYACRAGGWLVFRKVEPGPFLRAWLGHVPGAVFVALILPMVVAAGPPGWCAAGAGFAAMRMTGRFLVAMAAGVVAYAVLLRVLP